MYLPKIKRTKDISIARIIPKTSVLITTIIEVVLSFLPKDCPNKVSAAWAKASKP